MRIFLNLLMKFSLRIIFQLLRGSYALVGCKLYKYVAIVTCLTLTWVWGVTIFMVLELGWVLRH